MKTLKRQLIESPEFPKLIEEAGQLVESHVQSKKGMSGAIVKTTYKIATTAKADLVPTMLNKLLPEFTEALEPIYADAVPSGMDIGAYMLNRKPEVINALLSVTDARADASSNKPLKATYAKLRDRAELELSEVMPKVTTIIGKYAA